MSVKRNVLYVILAVLAVAVLLMGSWLLRRENSTSFHCNISVIMNGKNDSSFENIRYGMEQAAADFNAEISFVALNNEYNEAEQDRIINREVANGADAIVVAPSGETSVPDTIKSVMQSVPVVVVESQIKNLPEADVVSCDNFKTGQCLAQDMISRGYHGKTIAVVRNGETNTAMQQRFDGFSQEIVKSGNTIKNILCGNEDEDILYAVKAYIDYNVVDAVVGFDYAAVYNSVIAKREIKSKAEIFGVASGVSIIPMIESGEITALTVQNEYNMGYLAVSGAVDKLKKKKFTVNNVDYAVVDKSNLYSEKNQRLMFPIIA